VKQRATGALSGISWLFSIRLFLYMFAQQLVRYTFVSSRKIIAFAVILFGAFCKAIEMTRLRFYSRRNELSVPIM
jgi:hypothetical protein